MSSQSHQPRVEKGVPTGGRFATQRRDEAVATLEADPATGPVTSEPGVRIIHRGVRVDWDDLGEGWTGDFDPEDPTDEELLRFTVYRESSDPLDDGWSPVDDGSWCTQMPVTTSTAERQQILEAMVTDMGPAVRENASIKTMSEGWSRVYPGMVTWNTVLDGPDDYDPSGADDQDDEDQHAAEHEAERNGGPRVDRRVCQMIGCPYGDH